jgi:putative acetyltransferase
MATPRRRREIAKRFMLKIRPAQKNDTEALLQLHRDAVFSKAADYYDRARLESWSPGATPERIASLERQIADPKFITLVAEIEAEPVGFAMAIPSKNELRALYVKPNPLGNIGRILLVEIEKQAFEAGAQFFQFDASLNAEAFYKANGYKETGRANHISGNGETSAAVQLKKSLAGS